MATLSNEQEQSQIQNFSVESVRNLLDVDNKGLAKLCAAASLMPRKNQQGRTYFTKSDIEILKNVQNVPQKQTKSYATVPMRRNSINKTPDVMPLAAHQYASVPLEKFSAKLVDMENNITDKISKVIDEKLDGMDEVVVELVRCKTENETLRYKINELNKELFYLKNELNRYKSIGLGLYVKNSVDSSIL